MNGKLFVVGIGPGGEDHMTPAARAAIMASDVVAGYTTYLELIPGLLEQKRTLSTGMRREIERCRMALAEAAAGSRVALVCSGDAGIYGMAGLVLELAHEDGWENLPEIEIVPGVSAVQAAAARLGAPLMHDFAVISLSDLLTPWESIRRRLEAAASADFVVALYNPRSRGRTRQILEAKDILGRYRDPATPVGIVRSATRSDESVVLSDLANFTDHPIDMFSTVIIGNTATRLDRRGRMVTPRGYETRSAFEVRCSEVENQNLEPRTSNLEPAPARAIFVGGTGSDVGKSVLAAGLCRMFRRRGIRVAPFKAQNMALNSAATPEGGEIGRAQALQAAACGLEGHIDMNPVLLKPNSDTGSQVVVNGRPVGNMTVAEYHRFKPEAFRLVRESFERLAARHELVVMEGAGSIAEINLKAHDITNLRAAAMADAPVLLVADIDRGGVFASIVGTIELLEPEEKKRIAGIVINKFRGDPDLLRPGIEAVETRTGVPVLGVVPWIDLRLPEEDSVALGRKRREPRGRGLRIGVVRLPWMSNYTDFDPLEQEPEVDLLYLDDPDGVAGSDMVIIPGSKSTLSDLDFLRRKGFERALLDYHAAGGRIAGICGGYQMLGRRISDPDGVESAVPESEGLGLLDVHTVLRPTKQTHQVTGVPLEGAQTAGFRGLDRVAGYEIHMGETQAGPGVRPLWSLTRRSPGAEAVEDGAVDGEGRVWGTYLHGLFDDPGCRGRLLDDLRSRRGLPGGEAGAAPSLDEELDRLAAHLEEHLNVTAIERLLGFTQRESA